MKHENLVELIHALKAQSQKEKIAFWKTIAKALEGPTRKYPRVNIDKITKVCRTGETAVIAGKVLGKTKTTIQIASFQASEGARKRNTVMDLYDLMKKNPKAQKCRIVA